MQTKNERARDVTARAALPIVRAYAFGPQEDDMPRGVRTLWWKEDMSTFGIRETLAFCQGIRVKNFTNCGSVVLVSITGGKP